MEEYLSGQFHINNFAFQYIVLPILIIIARIVDVSIGTLRIMFVMSGRKNIAFLAGFLESLVWLLAIAQIMQNLTNPISYLAYPLGFALGTFFGIMLEEKLALGNVVVRLITKKPADQLIDHLSRKNFRYTNVDAESNEGPVNVLFTVVKRQNLDELLTLINKHNPKASFTIENVKKVSEQELPISKEKRELGFRNLFNMTRK